MQEISVKILFFNFLFIGSLDLDSMLKYQNILVFLSPVIGKMQFYPILPFMSHLNCIL